MFFGFGISAHKLGVLGLLFERSGNPITELVKLPIFWHRLRQVPTGDIKVEKVKYGDDPRQYLLFCTQEGVAATRPPVLYIHGGGWRFGHPERFIPNARVLTSRGHPVILPAYRKIPACNANDLREDLRLMLRQIQAVASVSPLWSRPWIIGGMSSGGNLAALMTFDEAIKAQSGIDQSFYAGAFFLGAPLDLEKMFPSLTLRQFAGKRGSILFHNANPIEHLRPENIQLPILVLHGDRDGIVEYENARSFVKRLEELHAPQLAFPFLNGLGHLDKAAWPVNEGRVQALLLEWIDKVTQKVEQDMESG